MDKLKIEGIFCEDIRLESNLKHILIGVFSDEVIVHVAPSAINMALWARVHGLSTGLHEIKIEAFYDADGDQTKFGELGAELDVLRGDRATVVSTPPLTFTVAKTGVLRYFITFDNGEPQEAGSLFVTLAADLS
jgi:hypothetical protein